MAHANPTLTPPLTPAESAELRRLADSMRRLVETMDKSRASMRQLKWMAIFWVSLTFIFTCWLAYQYVVLVILQ